MTRIEKDLSKKEENLLHMVDRIEKLTIDNHTKITLEMYETF